MSSSASCRISNDFLKVTKSILLFVSVKCFLATHLAVHLLSNRICLFDATGSAIRYRKSPDLQKFCSLNKYLSTSRPSFGRTSQGSFEETVKWHHRPLNKRNCIQWLLTVLTEVVQLFLYQEKTTRQARREDRSAEKFTSSVII